MKTVKTLIVAMLLVAASTSVAYAEDECHQLTSSHYRLTDLCDETNITCAWDSAAKKIYVEDVYGKRMSWTVEEFNEKYDYYMVFCDDYNYSTRIKFEEWLKTLERDYQIEDVTFVDRITMECVSGTVGTFYATTFCYACAASIAGLPLSSGVSLLFALPSCGECSVTSFLALQDIWACVQALN